MSAAGFAAVPSCWICGGAALDAVHEAIFDLSEYRRQDPELAAYTGATVELRCCRACGFAQPAALPSLPDYFDRMYDQRWADDWVATEHDAPTKDRIFLDILAALRARSPEGRTLLDVGAHAGRFLRLAGEQGWIAEGLELNPKTAAYAARMSGARVHRGNIHGFTPREPYDAVTLTDVLEHVPRPIDVLMRVSGLLRPGGWAAIKVPNGRAQRLKENVRARLRRGYRPTLADNLVHVNHFSAASLARALTLAGFDRVIVRPAAPELPSGIAAGERAFRIAAFRAARALPGGAVMPFSFNLQAYGRRG